jgi:peptidoglycan/xylan/chitin deacetylase (PgdA/CDA1 family)
MRLTLSRAVKHGLAAAYERSGASTLLRRAARVRGPRVHLFGYHRVVPDASIYEGLTIGPLCVSVPAFEAHLDHLTARYEVLALDDALDVLNGARRAPERDACVITFDDGYTDVLAHAAPILAARDLPATVYVSTGPLADGRPLPHDHLYALVLRVRARRLRLLGSAVPDRLVFPLARADAALAAGDPVAAADALLFALPIGDLRLVIAALEARVGQPGPEEVGALLDWSGIAALVDHGFTVGAHGVTHTHLPLEDDETLHEELVEPRAEIARRIGTPPSTFSYPCGRYDARVIEAVRAAGYRGAITTEDRRNRVGTDPFRVGRKVMHEHHGIGAFGRLAPTLAAAQLDGLFTTLGLARAVPGDQGLDTPWL